MAATNDLAPDERTPSAAAWDAATDPSKIALRDVAVRYDERIVFEGISLDVAEHEVVCLVGPSGCGKSTMLHLIAGLQEPSAGSVSVDGAPVTGPGADRVMVFQEDAVFPWMTVARNVDCGLRWQGMPARERRRRVQETIEFVGLAGNEALYPRQLSGGMRKRVDLARALAVRPAILLMDEPYAALDAMTKERLQVEFLRIHRSARMTTVFVTHDLEEALFLGDRVVMLGAAPGRVVDVVEVPFARPRAVELKRAQQFQQLRGRLADLLEGAHGGAAPGDRRTP